MAAPENLDELRMARYAQLDLLEQAAKAEQVGPMAGQTVRPWCSLKGRLMSGIRYRNLFCLHRLGVFWAVLGYRLGISLMSMY